MSSALSFAENQAVQNSTNVVISGPRGGDTLEIGTGFTAKAFRQRDFGGAMDPLVMVDHYRMTEPTFGAHPHAGLSAVSLLFEDSEGEFHNRDSLGNDFDLMPGDLYWLKAASGVIHDEAPRVGANIHGLQVFVNLPELMKQDSPESLHVKTQDMPVLETDGFRIRIVLGTSNGITGWVSPALPMTILDGEIAVGSTFVHELPVGDNGWVYLIKGEIDIIFAGKKVNLQAGEAICISAISASETNPIAFTNFAESNAHFVLFASAPVNETFVQKGPFVMSNEADIARVEADYAAGKLGHLK